MKNTKFNAEYSQEDENGVEHSFKVNYEVEGDEIFVSVKSDKPVPREYEGAFRMDDSGAYGRKQINPSWGWEDLYGTGDNSPYQVLMENINLDAHMLIHTEMKGCKTYFRTPEQANAFIEDSNTYKQFKTELREYLLNEDDNYRLVTFLLVEPNDVSFAAHDASHCLPMFNSMEKSDTIHRYIYDNNLKVSSYNYVPAMIIKNNAEDIREFCKEVVSEFSIERQKELQAHLEERNLPEIVVREISICKPKSIKEATEQMIEDSIDVTEEKLSSLNEEDSQRLASIMEKLANNQKPSNRSKRRP
jgi:hypothetical protein